MEISLKRILILCLLFTVFIFAQKKERIAVLPSVGELSAQELNLLTDRVREVATKMLHKNNFLLLRQEAVINALGGEEVFFAACKEGTCIGELAKKANADYGARCDVLKVGGDLVLKFELYSVKDDAILETFTDYDAKNFRGMLSTLDKRLPEVFKKVQKTSGVGRPSVVSEIVDLESAVDYEFNFEKRYLINVGSDPAGANLSFNGMPVSGCTQTPCKTELPGGGVRIIAALDQYETVDTTVFIKENNSSVKIKLKSNYGVLEIKPAYREGVGAAQSWNLTINGKVYTAMENRFSPGNYEIKLTHECYENIDFKAGIDKGSNEVYDMAKRLHLKKGGLDLSAKKDGEPVSEPVFVNGEQAGETPFSGTVPVCSEIAVGDGQEKVEVKILYKQMVKHEHELSSLIIDERDGKKYKIMKIGNQIWMAENVNYNTKGSVCYDHDPKNCEQYGRLYDWHTAMDLDSVCNNKDCSKQLQSIHQGICPAGFHVPTAAEWRELIDFTGGLSLAGAKLKSSNGWQAYSGAGNGTDDFGFNALPGGYFSYYQTFLGLFQNANFWAAVNSDAVDADRFMIESSISKADLGIEGKEIKYSLRCIKNQKEPESAETQNQGVQDVIPQGPQAGAPPQTEQSLQSSALKTRIQESAASSAEQPKRRIFTFGFAGMGSVNDVKFRNTENDSKGKRGGGFSLGIAAGILVSDWITLYSELYLSYRVFNDGKCSEDCTRIQEFALEIPLLFNISSAKKTGLYFEGGMRLGVPIVKSIYLPSSTDQDNVIDRNEFDFGFMGGLGIRFFNRMDFGVRFGGYVTDFVRYTAGSVWFWEVLLRVKVF